MSQRSLRTRLGVAFAAVALGAVALTACSGETESTVAEGTDTTGTTEEVDYFFSEGDAPENPERVLALWRVGSVLADLGVVPVGALEGELAEEELTDEQWATVDDVPAVGTYEGVDIEKVIELDPDLIIGMDNGGLSMDYAELAELYPVRILDIAEPVDVWRNYETVADLTGTTSQFDEGQAALDERLAAIKTEYGAALAGVPVTQVNVTQGEIWLSTSKSLVYERLEAAGFDYNSALTDDPDRYVAPLTRENIPSLADQGAIFYQINYDGSVSPDVQSLLDEPAFKELPAVQAGMLFPVRGSTIYTFAAANAMADDLEAAAQAISEKSGS